MSRIGRKPVKVPAGVKVTIQGQKVLVEGPVGKLSMNAHPEVKVAWDESEKLIITSIDQTAEESDQLARYWGTTRANIENMIVGVTKGYEKSLEVVGVGWTAAVQGKQLKLVIGYANPIMLAIPDGLKVTVDKAIVRIQGPDKQMVGQFAANARAQRKPEPYNGKGIKYTDEVIKRKQGKQFGA